MVTPGDDVLRTARRHRQCTSHLALVMKCIASSTQKKRHDKAMLAEIVVSARSICARSSQIEVILLARIWTHDVHRVGY